MSAGPSKVGCAHARFYDPTTFRFTQPDTIIPDPGKSQTLNRYSYGYNNPVKYNDPSGHQGVCIYGGWGSRAEDEGETTTATLCEELYAAGLLGKLAPIIVNADDFDSYGAMIAAINNTANMPGEPLSIIGYSSGASQALEVAWALNDAFPDVNIAELIMIEPTFDHLVNPHVNKAVPGNVGRALNLVATGNEPDSNWVQKYGIVDMQADPIIIGADRIELPTTHGGIMAAEGGNPPNRTVAVVSAWMRDTSFSKGFNKLHRDDRISGY